VNCVFVGANVCKCSRDQRFNVPSEARDSNFLVTQTMTDQHCLTSAITRRSALTPDPSSSSLVIFIFKLVYLIILRNKHSALGASGTLRPLPRCLPADALRKYSQHSPNHTLWTLYRSYFKVIRANIELQVYSVTCCGPYSLPNCMNCKGVLYQSHGIVHT
jgi:hypothetical protein